MKAVRVFGWAMTAFGMLAASIGTAAALGGDAEATALRIGFSLLVAAGGAFISIRAGSLQGPAALTEAEAERHILAVAVRRDGRLTATEVAADTPVPLAQADQILDGLVRRGACRMGVAEAGIVVFEFPGLEKAPAAREETARAASAAARQRAG